MKAPERDADFEALLQFLKSNRGFDFTGYKRSTLMRRVVKRMSELPNLHSFGAYREYLETHADEFTPLFNTILINVTSFFRDESAWEYLTREILPRIAAKKNPAIAIRVSCVGVASGEEAYTVAMLLARQLGDKALRDRVKIYATDVDGDALAQARHATYSAKAIDPVPADLRERYFERTPGGQYVVRGDLRRAVIFGRNDLVQDVPISRLDLLICRNTLMYFNAETQARILGRFHFALNDGGYLFLGKSEMLLTHANLFSTVDMKNRVFAKVSGASVRERLLLRTQQDGETAEHYGRQIRLRDIAFDSSPLAQILVDSNNRIVATNAVARQSFAISATDLGKPLQDLEISYRPVELRSLIQQLYNDHVPIDVRDIRHIGLDGEEHFLNVRVSPLIDADDKIGGVLVTFVDTSEAQRLQESLHHTNEELETANEELQSTNEELETTNEELQSTNEELETTNEELQSSNEELETMNEELQATNEELETTNDELQIRTEEFNQTNVFLRSVLGALRVGVAVLNRRSEILIWNSMAEELWGVHADEVQGQSLFALDIGLPVDQLKSAVRSCMTKEKDNQELIVNATNRRGKAFRCRVTCRAWTSPSEDGGAILMMEEARS